MKKSCYDLVQSLSKFFGRRLSIKTENLRGTLETIIFLAAFKGLLVTF